ncbi:Uncharacterised protein [Mycobacteroides abscessus subsp. abscessus]|nr:Uncharacterised protein [Mycobacteroides abscessus subsp. abscessus]
MGSSRSQRSACANGKNGNVRGHSSSTGRSKPRNISAAASVSRLSIPRRNARTSRRMPCCAKSGATHSPSTASGIECLARVLPSARRASRSLNGCSTKSVPGTRAQY